MSSASPVTFHVFRKELNYQEEKSQQKSIGLMAVLWIYAAVLKAESSPVDVEVSRHLSPGNIQVLFFLIVMSLQIDPLHKRHGFKNPGERLRSSYIAHKGLESSMCSVE